MKTARALLCVSLAAAIAGSLPAQVTFDRILHAGDEPQNWLTYSGTLQGWRHTPLTQITLQNIKDLELKWVWQARSLEKFEATALVSDGILYTVQAPNDLVALDAATGRTFWTHSYTPSREARVCCGRVNRGAAILGDTLFIGTIDAHLIAVDAKNGKLLWNVAVAQAAEGYSLTHAPLVIKEKVIIGTAGGDLRIRGFIAAFDSRTGKEAWRFHTIPGPGEAGHETWSGDSWQHGGGSVWVTGSYDPESNLTYWGIGNPGPDDYNADSRQGDNLYSCSVIALDADTGKLKWHYQFTPHDESDWDSVQVPVLANIDWRRNDGSSKPRKVLLLANRNGFFYVLDRTTGQFLMAKPFVKVTWASGFDENGRPVRVPGQVATIEGTQIFPALMGGTNWFSPSYSPKTGLFYVPANDDTSSIFTKLGMPKGGLYGMGGTTVQPNLKKEDEGHGVVRAIDPRTGEIKWDFKMNDLTQAGILTTASNLLFSGGREGYFYALDARNGKLLWKASLGGQVNSGPISYSVDGKQYIAIAAGNSLFAYALR